MLRTRWSRSGTVGVRFLGPLVALAMAVVLAACGSDEGGGSSTGGAGGEKYKAILLNPFIGNDWRPQMQKYATAAVGRPPLSDSIESVRIVTTQDNDPNLQSPALQSAIVEKPDILAIDASSETALNGLIEQACQKGITVVTFDVFASAPCAWKLGPDWEAVGRSWGKWIVEQAGGEGKVLIDRGEAGTSSSDGINKGVDEVLDANPEIEAIEYNSKFNPGEETKAVAQLLAANPDVKGILSQAYAAQEALGKANMNVPATGFNYPPAMQACVKRNATCMLVGVPPWMSADALKLAVEVRKGERKGAAEFVPFPVPFLQSNNDIPPETENIGEVLDLEKELTPDTPKSAFLPISPPWVDIPFDEIVG